MYSWNYIVVVAGNHCCIPRGMSTGSSSGSSSSYHSVDVVCLHMGNLNRDWKTCIRDLLCWSTSQRSLRAT